MGPFRGVSQAGRQLSEHWGSGQILGCPVPYILCPSHEAIKSRDYHWDGQKGLTM